MSPSMVNKAVTIMKKEPGSAHKRALFAVVHRPLRRPAPVGGLDRGA